MLAFSSYLLSIELKALLFFSTSYKLALAGASIRIILFAEILKIIACVASHLALAGSLFELTEVSLCFEELYFGELIV